MSEPLTKYFARSSCVSFSIIISDLLNLIESLTFNLKSSTLILSENKSVNFLIDCSLGFCSISIAKENTFLSSANTIPSREIILPLFG